MLMKKEKIKLDMKCYNLFKTIPQHLQLECVELINKEVPISRYRIFNCWNWRKIYRIILKYKKEKELL